MTRRQTPLKNWRAATDSQRLNAVMTALMGGYAKAELPGYRTFDKTHRRANFSILLTLPRGRMDADPYWEATISVVDAKTGSNLYSFATVESTSDSLQATIARHLMESLKDRDRLP